MNDMDQDRNLRDRANMEELTARIESSFTADGAIEPFSSIHLTRSSQNREEVYGVLQPAFCVIVQGAKDVYMGGKTYRYDAEHYLLATVELPVRGVRYLTDNHPYLALMIDLDPSLIRSVMVEAGLVSSSRPVDSSALGVSRMDSNLIDAVARIIRLLESPEDAKHLIPPIKREIVYRLLKGEHGQRLRQLPSPGAHPQRIFRALDRLRHDFDQPLTIDGLAKEVGMSPTRLHHHFKEVTGMSPLQFQKRLRLHEARRLMLSDDVDASGAGYKVGYDDPSHFSRDYKRQFGRSPMKDISLLKSAEAANISQA